VLNSAMASLRSIPSPCLFSPGCEQFSAFIEFSEFSEFGEFGEPGASVENFAELPPSLTRAAESRKTEYLAGEPVYS
jgi:hypothetical protein